MSFKIGVTVLLLAVALAAAGQGADVSFEEVCVPAKALGLAGRDVGSFAVLAWHRGEPMHLPWRVAAVEMDATPLVNVTDVDRSAGIFVGFVGGFVAAAALGIGWWRLFSLLLYVLLLRF